MKKHMTQEVAIKSAWMILEGLGYDRARNDDMEKTVTAVYESAPAADVVERRHGRWIKDGEDGPVCCSECGEEHEWDDYRALYCDTCGAKMDGGQDDVC